MDYVLAVMIFIALFLNFVILMGFISAGGTDVLLDLFDKKSKRNRLARLLAKEIKKIYGNDTSVTMIHKDYELIISCKSKKQDKSND